MGFHCLLQSKEGLLLFLMLSLYLMTLLFKYFNVILENVGVDREKYGNIETRAKNFSFHLCIVDLGTITGFLAKPNRTSKT